MNVHIKNIYDEAKKYNLDPYEFDRYVLDCETRINEGTAFDIFNRVTEGEHKGRIIGLNRELFIQASKITLMNLSNRCDEFKEYGYLNDELEGFISLTDELKKYKTSDKEDEENDD